MAKKPIVGPIEREWRTFRKMALRGDDKEGLEDLLRGVFYAGLSAGRRLIIEMAGDETLTPADYLQQIKADDDELRAYLDDINARPPARFK